MFFGNFAPDNSTLTMFHHVCARHLHSIANRLRPGMRWRKEKWAHQIRMLVHDLGTADATDRVYNVIEWLLTAHAKQNIQVTSAERFRSNFTWIEVKYNKLAILDKPLSADALAIVKATKRLLWPKGVPDDLQQFIQTSEASYVKFREEFKRVFANRDKYPKLKGAINWLYRKLSDPVTFVTKWAERVHTMTLKWDDWSGSLKSFSFDPDSKVFRKQAMGWAAEYDGTGKCWFKVLDLMR